ncbi:hypothetical protein NVP1244A_092 [Vibrio phage 1.244.A._10N.261.54.C3]|nr:hypothetical protein NVP1244A_092 [Vibrio phage 1.244.A._10N.261.54.C3]AUR98720.1 hypothetical protein NVP1255O_092 [Vibrio phage 1.255.O._10N.286.45.F1]
MALKDRLETLGNEVFISGEALIEAFYAEMDLEVEWLDSCNGEYVTWQIDSKFDNGRAEGSRYSDMEITSWALRKLIETMVG